MRYAERHLPRIHALDLRGKCPLLPIGSFVWAARASSDAAYQVTKLLPRMPPSLQGDSQKESAARSYAEEKGIDPSSLQVSMCLLQTASVTCLVQRAQLATCYA